MIESLTIGKEFTEWFKVFRKYVIVKSTIVRISLFCNRKSRNIFLIQEQVLTSAYGGAPVVPNFEIIQLRLYTTPHFYQESNTQIQFRRLIST
jgi:hypothetical protein